MSRKNFYSDEDIALAREALSGLPDLTPQRKTQKEFLDGIKDMLLALIRTKGYTVSDIKETLKSSGYEISEKALRELVRDAGKARDRREATRTPAVKTEPLQE